MEDKCICSVNSRCTIRNISNCPCKTCVVNSMCSDICYERHIYGAEDLNYEPVSEKAFKGRSIDMSLRAYTKG